MKRTTLILTAAVCLSAILSGCSSNGTSSVTETSESAVSSGLSAAERTASLLEEGEFPSMVELSEEMLSSQLGVSAEDVTEYSVYICASGAAPDEFGILVAADGRADEVKAAIQARLDKQEESFGDYKPDEMYKFDDCFVKTDGNTVCYAVCADNVLAEEILLG